MVGTSCSGPNIQQLPSGSPIRQAITARPGHLLFIIDYNSLELRTLATVCHQRIGFSKLRDVLIEGIDPHSYAAAMFAGVTLEQFNELPNKKQLRQRAKVFNFGLPVDGCKAAMWNLTKAGYRIVAFIHDEFVIELSRLDEIDQAAQEIERICTDSMQPFVPGIPVPCEYALTERWDKRAEAVRDDAGRLQVWKPVDQPSSPALSCG